MKNQFKEKAFLKKCFSIAILIIGLASYKAYSQNNPGQMPGQPTPNPTQTLPGTQPMPNAPTTPPPPMPNDNLPTMPPAPNLNLPTEPKIDTSNHLYNPIKPDTGKTEKGINTSAVYSKSFMRSITFVGVRNDNIQFAILPCKSDERF